MTVKCPFEGCEKSFSCKAKLKDHENTHLNIKPYSCDICTKKFSCKRYLDAHAKSHSTNFCCENCNISFNRLHNLKRHRAQCLKTYTCKCCNKTYKKRGCYETHLKSCLIKAHKCNSISGSLVRTESSSADIKQIEQTSRSKAENSATRDNIRSTNKSAMLIRDTLIHLKEDRECSDGVYCSNTTVTSEAPSFTEKANQAHTVAKSAIEKLAVCEICKAEYGEKKNLILHKKAKHFNVKFECNICGLKFSHASSLKRHVKKSHKFAD